MRQLLLAALLSLVAFAGCLSDDPDEADEDAATADDFVPRVVVGILDTGMNVYHDEFRQVRLGEDGNRTPSEYLSGYPADARRLDLTLDFDNATTGQRDVSWANHLERDSDAWNETEPGVLYWVPGTKVVGLIGFGRDVPGAGHGSMTSSRATGNTISIPGSEVLLVHVAAPLALSTSVGDDDQAQATRWMADQAFIDIQSHSWGMPFTCAGVATTKVYGWAEAFKYAREKQLVLVAAGNGAGNTGVTPGYPSQCQDNSGIAGVVAVGATDNAGSTTWGNFFPAIAGDACSNPAISEETLNETSNNGGGTSSATPFSAGGAAKIVLEARRTLRDPRVGIRDGIVAELHAGGTTPATGPLSDGVFTLDELKSVLFHTAISPPTMDDSDGDECMAGTRVPLGPETASELTFPFIGYGEVNRESITLAVDVINGLADEPVRAQEDELYQQDQELRRAFWG